MTKNEELAGRSNRNASGPKKEISPSSNTLLCDYPIGVEVEDQFGGINYSSPAWESEGKKLCDIFVKYGEIKKDDLVLDLGCGTGRILKHLKNHCSVRGFEINSKFAVHANKFAEKIIHVRTSDIEHPEYNPRGTMQHKSDYPYSQESFDKIVACAVINHQSPERVFHILKNCMRILKSGGSIIFTAYLYNKKFEFGKGLAPNRIDNFWYTENKNRVMLNNVFDSSMIARIIKDAGGTVKKKIFPGRWKGVSGSPSDCDIVEVIKI